jgi:outer membrane lipopolysaccharide assembly protein LptE/RlpB
MMRSLLAALLVLALFGCGYSFNGGQDALPGQVERLYLPLFVNQTTEPRLENQLSRDISEVFGRRPDISQVESVLQAEAILEGIIVDYSIRALSYDDKDNIVEYRALMTVEAKLRQVADGRLLWQGQVSWDDEYNAADDKSLQEDLERDAIEEISLRIAEELLSRLYDNF